MSMVHPQEAVVDSEESAVGGEWVVVCRMEDIPRRGSRTVEFMGREVAVFRTHWDNVLAVENKCPHRGGKLSEGIVTGNHVVCPLHAWRISLDTGEAAAPDKGCTHKIPALVRHGDVYLAPPKVTGEAVSICDRTELHPDSGKPRLGRRRAMREHFSVQDFTGDLPVLAVEPPSPVSVEDHRLAFLRGGEILDVLSIEDLRQRYRAYAMPSNITCLMYSFSAPVRWVGISLADVLRDMVEPEDRFGSFYSWDTQETSEGERFFETLPMAYMRDPRTMLAFELNGEPLPRLHGGPLRLVVPFLQGYKSVKWLTEIRLTRVDEIGYKKKHGFIEFPEFTPPANWKPSWRES